MRPDDYALQTHCEMLASTGGGKTKGAESNARECVRARASVVALDWKKGGLCHGLLAWLAFCRPRVPIIDFKPSGKRVVPFNVFACPAGEDPEEHAVRMAGMLLRSQGDERTADMPMYRETLPMVLAVCAATGETVQSASRMLHFHNRDLCLTAASLMRTDHLRDKWRSAASIKTAREWDYQFGSTRRKLEPFLHEGPLRRFTSASGSVDFTKLRDEDGIFLADLSGISDESGRIFAALILGGLLHASATADEEVPTFAYLDEPQEYETADMISLLNLSRSSGMRLTFIHHFSDQWADAAIAKSCAANARLTYAMHGLPLEACKQLAETHFLPQLNERWHKQAKWYTETTFMDGEGLSTTTRDDGSVSETVSDRLIPVHERILDGYEDYARDEKISMLAEPLLTLAPGEYCKLTPYGEEWGTFPHVRDYSALLNPERVLEFRESLHPPSAPKDVPVQEPPQASSPERSRPNASRPKRAKKAPVDLFGQG